MEKDRKIKDNNSPDSFKRRHFARLHEKIRNKYMDMQQKLKKSKSLDSLMPVNDELVCKERSHSIINGASFVGDVFCETVHETVDDNIDNRSTANSLIVEDIIKQNATLIHISNEESVCDPESYTPIIEDEQTFPDYFYTSLESINEDCMRSNESLAPHTPPTPNSIRDRISSRLSSAKQKRLRNEKEKSLKNSIKDKKKEPKKESLDKVEKFVFTNSQKLDVLNASIPSKKRHKVATVTIALIEATVTDIQLPTDEKTLTSAYSCRIRMNTEKRKSKTVKIDGLLVRWLELFNLNMYEESSILEISILDKDILIGRTIIDLSEINKEKTYRMKVNLEEGIAKVEIFFLLTISGTALVNTFLDMDDSEATKTRIISNKHVWYRFKRNDKDIGWLSIIVYGAKGLSTNESYCVVELDNERLQTQTEYKTNDPNWMKMFSFSVTDITSILVFTVCDEKKSEEIGKVSIPLLKINDGIQKWYALKDSTQRERAKGNNPRILLEMRFTFNIVKASIRVIHPKETKYLETEDKLDRRLFAQNLSRARVVVNWTLDSLKLLKTCFEWESRRLNNITLSTWILFCWFFEIWMSPLLLVIPFIYYRPQKYRVFIWNPSNAKIEEKEPGEKKSLRQKYRSLQDMIHTAQNAIGKFASLGESVKNLFNFTVPFLSGVSIFFIVVITCIMYFVPIRFMGIGWGVYKYTRKILRPNRIPNNEIVDLLSRVPDDETLNTCEELPLEDKDEV